MNKAEFKCEQLEKEVFLLKQELEFREMETNEYKERELQLKRMNQSLLKALEEQKPNTPEIKLMVEQFGGGNGEKEKALQRELERLRSGMEEEITSRVRRIVDDIPTMKDCIRCKDWEIKHSDLELDYNRSRGKVNALNDYVAELQNKNRDVMDQLQAKQTKLLEAEMEFKRLRDSSERQIQRLRNEGSEGTEEYLRLETEFRDKISTVERSKEEDLMVFKRELERNFEAILQEKVMELRNNYEQQLQQRVSELKRNYQTTRRDDDPTKRVSRMTPVKTLRYTQQAQVYPEAPLEGQSHYQTQRPSVSPSWRKQNRSGSNNATNIREIQAIISGLSKNRGGESQVSGFSNGHEECHEYSNFSIKESIIRPNGLVENHLKLKNRFN